MKITSLMASPRLNGNTATVLNRFCDTAEKLGASVQRYVLNKLQYKGCQGCLACKTKSDKCVLHDDLTEVLENIRNGDLLVMGTPVYIGDFASTLRAVIERMYSFFVPDFATNPKASRISGKKLVFIQVQGQPSADRFADLFPRMDPVFKRFGFEETHLIRVAGARKVGDAQAQANTMQLAADLAKKIVTGA